MTDVKISKIVITIGDRDIVLTPEEAQELKQCLDKMYPSPIIKETIKEHHYDRYTLPRPCPDWMKGLFWNGPINGIGIGKSDLQKTPEVAFFGNNYIEDGHINSLNCEYLKN